MKPKSVSCISMTAHDRELIRHALLKEHDEFEIIEAGNHEEFEKHLAEINYDLILSDFNILGFDGLQVLQIVKEKAPGIPVIIVTGTGSEEIAIQAMKMGAADYVIKSVRHIRGLVHTIQTVLENKKVQDEHKIALAAQRESEELYRAVFENSSVAILLTSPDGRVLSANDFACKVFGRTEKEICQAGRNGLIDSSDPRMSGLLDAGKKTGRAKGELTFIRKDGSTFEGEVSSVVFLDKEGNERTSMVIRDLTQQKKAEESLFWEQYLMVALMDNIPDAIYFKDPESRFLRINKAMAHLFGLDDPLQALGKTDNDFFEAEHSRKAYNDEQEIIRTGIPKIGIEEMETWHDRLPTWVSTTKMPLIDAKGKIIGTFGISRSITEHKMAEEALRKSEARFRSYFELSGVGIAITSSTKGWVEVNDCLCEMLGYSREELRHLSWADLTYPEDLGNDMEQFNRVMLKEIDGYSIDKRFIRKNKGIIWINLSVHCVRLADGTVDYFVALLFDISDRKKAEEELTFRNILLSTQQEASIDGILVVDENSTIVSFNRRFEEMLGIPHELIENRIDGPVLQFVTEQILYPEQFLERVNYLYKHREETSYEEMDLRDGRTFERYSSPMLGPDERYYGRIWYFHDITKRRKAEEAIRKERILLHTLVNNLPHAIYVKDKEGRKLLANAADLQVMNCTSESEIIGKTDLEIFDNESGKSGYAEDLSVLQTGQPLLNLENNYPDAQGKQHWRLISKIPLFDENKMVVGLVGFGHDITERKQAEDAMVKLKENLELQVEEKTKELQKRIAELERFHDATIEREFRMKELRDEIELLRNTKS